MDWGIELGFRWVVLIGLGVVLGLRVEARETERRVVLFLGDSLTAGYGLEKEQAFPAHVQAKIDSVGLPFEVVNAGVSGDTSSGGLRRIDWMLKRRVDVLVLALGANDALRGVPLDVTQKNLQGIVEKARAKYPNVQIVVAGMEAPPNMGVDYTGAFREIFRHLAEKNEAALIPFLLEGVAGFSELNQPDRIHPTVEGQQMVAENVWKVLKPVLEDVVGAE